MDRRAIATLLLASAGVAAMSTQRAVAQTCTPPCFPQSIPESNAGVTPAQTQYPPGDIRRYHGSGDPDYTNAIQTALKVQADVYIPAGTWNVSASLDVNVGNGANRRIYGDGMEVSIINVTAAVDAFKSSCPLLRITMSDLQIHNTNSSGNGVYFGPASQVQVAQSNFTNVFSYVGGRAFYLPNEFATIFTNCLACSTGNNAFELQGGSATVLNECYAIFSPAGYYGFRIYFGAVLNGCNGVIPNLNGTPGGDWGLFGGNTAEGDPLTAYPNVTMLYCNIEDWNQYGIRFRTPGWIRIANCGFGPQSSGTYQAEIYFEQQSYGVLLENVIFPIATNRIAKSPVYAGAAPAILCVNCVYPNTLTTVDVSGTIFTIPSLTIQSAGPGTLQMVAHYNSLAATELYNYYCGTQSLSGGVATVSFASAPQFDNLYKVILTGNANETFYVTNKQTTGFQINSSNPGSSATVDWFVARSSPT